MQGGRRSLLLAAGSAFVVWPLALRAQQSPKVWRVGILGSVALTEPSARINYGAFLDRMRELGYIEGTTLAVEWRFADGKFERLPALAAELVKAEVDVILTNGTPAVSAARRVTKTVPIVTASFADPVGAGFAASLARPGGNVTGLSTLGEVVYAKRLDLVIEVEPGARRIGWLANPDNAFHARVLPMLQAAAKQRGREIVPVNGRDAQQLRDAFSLLAREKATAVVVADDSYLNSQSGIVAKLALQYKLASIMSTVRGAEDGGLMSYGPDVRDRFRSAAAYVDKIFKGAKPGDLPIEQPSKFDFVVNRKTAAALGITIPQSVLLRADRVIE